MMTLLYPAMAAGLAVIIVCTLMLVSLTRRVRRLEKRAEIVARAQLAQGLILDTLALKP